MTGKIREQVSYSNEGFCGRIVFCNAEVSSKDFFFQLDNLLYVMRSFRTLKCKSFLLILYLRVEGRSWYTPHRGRLWIAATAKRPSPQEVSELQTTYRFLRGKGNTHIFSFQSYFLKRGYWHSSFFTSCGFFSPSKVILNYVCVFSGKSCSKHEFVK